MKKHIKLTDEEAEALAKTISKLLWERLSHEDAAALNNLWKKINHDKNCAVYIKNQAKYKGTPPPIASLK